MLNFLQWLVIIIIIKITNHVNQASKLCALNYKHLSFIRTYIYFLLTMVQTLLRKLIFFCTKRINILVVSRILGILGKRLLAIKSHDGVYIWFSLRRKIQELTLENHPAIFWNKCYDGLAIFCTQFLHCTTILQLHLLSQVAAQWLTNALAIRFER